MNNAVTTQHNSLASAVDQDYDPFADDQEDVGGYQGQFLSFSGKTGEYTFGEDEDEIEPGTTAYVDIQNLARGWICWDDGEVLDETMVRWLDGPPMPKRDLQDHGPHEEEGDGWKQQIVVPMYIPDEDDRFLLKLSSSSGYRNLVRFFQKDYGKEWKKHIGSDGLPQVPVIKLDVDSFKAKDKKIGKIYYPDFEIVDWVDYSEVASKISGSDDDGEDSSDYDDDETPKRPARKASKPSRKSKPAQEEPEDEDEGDNPDDYEEQEEKPKRRKTKPVQEQPEDESEEVDDQDEEEEEEERPRTRKKKSASVVHTEPQDSDEEEEQPTRRKRRGRNL